MRTHVLIRLFTGLLTITSLAHAQNGTWNLDLNGTWDNPANWLGNTIADGTSSLADLSTLDITANRTVTLDTARSIGHLKFGDTSGSQSWTIVTNGITDVALTLVTVSGAPTITVNNNTATNRHILSGTQGFVKLGAGSLALAGSANNYSGQTIVSNGALFLNKSSGVAIPGDLTLHSSANASLLVADQIADNSVVTLNVGGTLNLNGKSETIGTLILHGGVITNSSGSPTLQAGNSFDVHSGEAHAILAGAGKPLIKTTSGTVILNANNTYSGGTLISGGILQIGNGAGTGTPGSGSAAITNNAELVFNRSSAGGVLTISGVISGSGSITKLGDGTVAITGANTYEGDTTINNGVINISSSSTLGDGTGVVNLSGGTLNSTAQRTASSAPVANPLNVTADSEITTTSGSAAVDLNFSNNSITGSGGTLTFRNDGADSAADTFEPRFSGGNFIFARPIVIDNGSVGQTRLNSFNTNGTTQTFGGAISGNGAFRKSIGSGTGGLTIFNGNNTYSGSTTVNAGMLLVNGALGTNTTTVGSGATLGGSGTIHGPVILQSGATLSPGSSIGTLTISNSLALNSGSITAIELNAINHTSDKVAGLASVAYGGTLQLNISGSLSGGESFQLFSAGAYSGTFNSVTPATPGAGLIWNTNGLAVNGTLAIVNTNAVQQPSITNVTRMIDGRMQFAFSGSSGQNYRVWASINPGLTPVTNTWTLLTNSTFGVSPVVFADSQATNFAQRFYIITVP
jgi:autotransporter-associated beta strand protein